MIDMQADASSDFPAKTLLWPGAVLGTIAHSLFVARAPFMSYEQSWDGMNYSVNDGESSRGTIAFGGDKVSFVGVFYYDSSSRNPLKSGVPTVTDATVFVRKVPPQLTVLANEALQYVYQDINGTTMPIITAAFWSDPISSRVTASERWSDVMANGAKLVRNIVLPLDIAMTQWTENYEFDENRVSLARALLERRLMTAELEMRLTAEEAKQVSSLATGDEGREACQKVLKGVGIAWP